MKRIHIVGVSPRSGTTLMLEALKVCSNVDFASTHEDRLFVRAPKRVNIFLSKSPKDIMIVRPSLSIDPNLYIICMIRDPRDIISSKHKKDPEKYWASLKFWKEYTKEFDRLTDYSRFIPVRYEYFVSNPDKVQDLLITKIPFLEKKYLFSEFQSRAEVSESSKQALGKIRQFKPTSVGKWKQHKERIAGQMSLHGSLVNDLIKYGFENDNSWLEELDGMDKDLRPSHFSEYFYFKVRMAMKFGRYLEAFRRLFENMINHKIRIRLPKYWFNL